MVGGHSNRQGQGGPHGSNVMPRGHRLLGLALQSAGPTRPSSGRAPAGFAGCVSPPLGGH